MGEYDKRTAIDCHRYGREADCNIEPVVIAIEEIITHPEYQPSQGTLKNDIAIIRLAEEAKFSGKIIIIIRKVIVMVKNVFLRSVWSGSCNWTKINHP